MRRKILYFLVLPLGFAKDGQEAIRAFGKAEDERKYGFCGVIHKPYNANQASEIIRDVLMGNVDKRGCP